MARLIDADALLKSEIRRCGRVPTIGTGYINEKDFESVLEETTTVDAVPVVRCRDCKYGMHFGDPEDEQINCKNLHGEPLMPFYGFCSYGERKDGDGNG